MCRRKFVIFRKRGAVCANRSLQLADSRVRETEVVVGVGIRAPPIFYRGAVGIDCLRDFALRVVGSAKPEISFGKLPGLLERFLLRPYRFIQLALAEVSETKVVIRLRKLAVALIDCGAQSGNGTFQITQFIKRPAQIAECSREDRLLLNGQPELFGRFVEHSQVRKRNTKVVMRCREVAAPLLNCCAE